MQKLSPLMNAMSDKRDGLTMESALRGIYQTKSTQLFNSGAIAAGSTATKVQLAAAVLYMVNGVLCLKAITDDLWTMPTVTIAHDAPNIICLYLDAAGTATAVAGGAGAVVSGNGTAPTYIKFPPTPENKCLIGFVMISTASTDWVGGTNDVATAGAYTATFYNTVGATFDQTATI